MTGRKTLRSIRTMLLMAFGAAFCAYLFVFFLVMTVSGDLPDYSAGRMLAMVAIMAAVLFFGVACLASMRWRVVIKDEGIDIVGTFRRDHLTWDDITALALRHQGRFWDIVVSTSGKEHSVLMVPVSLLPGDPEVRYTLAPPHSPRRVRERYERLRGAWLDYRANRPGSGG